MRLKGWELGYRRIFLVHGSRAVFSLFFFILGVARADLYFETANLFQQPHVVQRLSPEIVSVNETNAADLSIVAASGGINYTGDLAFSPDGTLYAFMWGIQMSGFSPVLGPDAWGSYQPAQQDGTMAFASAETVYATYFWEGVAYTPPYPEMQSPGTYVVEYNTVTNPSGRVVIPAAASGSTPDYGRPYEMILGPDGYIYISFPVGGIARFMPHPGASRDEFSLQSFVNVDPTNFPNVAGITFGPDYNLYAACPSNNSVLCFSTTNGSLLNVVVPSGAGGLSNPHGIAFGPDGNLYVGSFVDYFTGHILRYRGNTGAFIDEFVPLMLTNGLPCAPVHLAFSPRLNVPPLGRTGPTLSIKSVQSTLNLGWKTYTPFSFTVETATNLGPNAVWTPLPWTSTTAGLLPSGVVPNGNRQFFRVRLGGW